MEQARLFFEKMLGYGNHLGLYAEQLDLRGHQLGNYPQAFTHLGLISAAFALNRELEAYVTTLSGSKRPARIIYDRVRSTYAIVGKQDVSPRPPSLKSFLRRARCE